MRKMILCVSGLLMVMSLAANLMPASAACPGARAVTSATTQAMTFFYTPGNPFTPTGNFPLSPYGGSTTYYINGVFWSYGSGDPTYGLGNDSGYFKGYSYVLAEYLFGMPSWMGGGYYGGFPTFLGGPYGHWQIPGVDGCISLDDPGSCNVVLLTDEADQTGYFGLLSVNANAGGDFEYTNMSGFPAAVTLAPIPVPQILATTNVGPSINVTVTVDPGTLTPDNGFYLNCTEPTPDLVSGYKVYVRTLPQQVTPKPIQFDSRAITQIFGPPLPPWVPVTPSAVPIGQDAQFQLTTLGSEQFYLCATLVFGGVAPGAPNYELKNCSLNSTKIVIILADPEEAVPERRIDRGQATPARNRGLRRGR